MPDNRPPDEVLVIRGKLDRAGRFTPRRCTSTRHVRAWPETESREYVVELLNSAGAVLHREPARIDPVMGCGPGEAGHLRVTAYIALREDAAMIALRHEEIVVWQAPILPPPTLEIRPPRRPSRREPVRLRFAFSEPGPGAFLQVIYQWGERRFAVIANGPPEESLEVDLAALPGGRECRFVVQYSNGQRSAVGATPAFILPLRGPELRITSPPPRTVLVFGQPLVLEGQVLDPERPGGPRSEENLSWWVNEHPAGRGPIGGLDQPVAGRHRIVLRYQGVDVVSETALDVLVRAYSESAPVPAADWPEFERD